MKNKILAIVSMLMLLACTHSEEVSISPQSGIWRGVIALNDSTNLPFNFSIEPQDSAYRLTIHNASERIEAKMVEQGDSFKIQLPVFAPYLMVKVSGGEMKGFFINPDGTNYRLPFTATFGDSTRFTINKKNCCDINRKWAVVFSPGTEDETPAIAYLNQRGEKVTGTFLTETGDYRYLQGILSGKVLQLSSFSGGDLYYFKAYILDGQQIRGHFYSGRSYEEPFRAYRDDSFNLRNADSLTYLKEGYDHFDFSFDNVGGDVISLDDPRFKDKPVIVQIMGSWCPNCMDETRYMKQVYQQYHAQGLEIVGLTFERAKDKATAKKRVDKMIRDLEIPYPILIAGFTRQDKADSLLPSLNHVMSFPTAIYLNPDHSVMKIHTGFTGPGTPFYDQFVNENKSVINQMLSPDDSSNTTQNQ